VSISKDKFAAKDNGLPVGELDEATREKAEARYYNYYELYADPDPKATGPADFH
jgi:pre-mRNA-processing factor 39